jgi:hypothetical protein
MNLLDEIITLINLKCEDNYWDFKEFPEENKACLLHDIICLSNSLHTGPRYLIFGVKDPEYGAEIVGLKKKQANRRNQAQFITFLRSKIFAGDIRPEVKLETITINGNEIDVLIIQDNPYKPYYLKEDFQDKDKKVLANFIYTRIGDTNTPRDKSADIYIIEKMWAQRFGLNLNLLDRFLLLLKKPNEWFKDIGNVKYCYYKKSPEFQIEFSTVEEFKEVYCLYYPNPVAYLGKTYLKYFSTTLLEIEFMYCDEMRIVLPTPDICSIDINEKQIFYYYFNLEEPSGALLHFFTGGTYNLNSRGGQGPFLIFSDKTDQDNFESYLSSNPELLDEPIDTIFPPNADLEVPGCIDRYQIGKIAKIFKTWKKTA